MSDPLPDDLDDLAYAMEKQGQKEDAHTVKIAAERIRELAAYRWRAERYLAAQRALREMWEDDRE